MSDIIEKKSNVSINTVNDRLERYKSVKNINISDKTIEYIAYKLSLDYSSDADDDVIFAYVYSDNYTNEVDYICLGNNSISKDGSYMSGFMKYKNINSLFKEKIIKGVYENIILLIPDINKRLVYKKAYMPEKNIKKCDELPVNMFCIKVLIFYILRLIIIKKESRIFNKDILEKIKDITHIKDYIKDIHKSDLYSIMGTKGQKIVPKGYYYKEGNIIKKREYDNELQLLYLMSKDIFARKTPAFPILISFTKLSGVCLEIFDNPSLYSKLTTSAIISQNKAYKLKDLYTGHINIFITEDCGYTFSKYISKEKKMLGNFKEDTKSLHSILFQCVHAVYCINKHGFIHGDTHMSNITVRETVKWFSDSKVFSIKNTCSIFSTTKYKYCVPFYGAYITLIDLGRAIDISYIKKYFYKHADLVEDFYKRDEIILSLDDKIKNKKQLEEYVSKLGPECILNIYNLIDILRIINGISSLLHNSTSVSDTSNAVLQNIKKYLYNRIKNIIERNECMNLEKETECIINDNFKHFIYSNNKNKINIVDEFI